MGLMVFGWWWWWWWFREKTWTWQWCYIHVKKPLEIARSFQRSKGYGVKPRIGAGIGSTLAWHGHHPAGTSRSMIYSDALDSTFEADMFSLLTAVQILVHLRLYVRRCKNRMQHRTGAGNRVYVLEGFWNRAKRQNKIFFFNKIWPQWL